MADIRDKIKKLLALAESPNENEAKAALLKAKELMAKHKISESEFEDTEDVKLRHVECAVKWTTDSGNIWMTSLARLISENYCCTAGWATRKGTRTHTLVITGIGEDVEICKAVIEYATNFVLKQIKVMQRKWRQSDPKSVATSYADGFILGLEMAYEEQQEEHPEWALAVVKPQEVAEYEKSMEKKTVTTQKASFNPLAYLRGQVDGKDFDMSKHIGEVN